MKYLDLTNEQLIELFKISFDINDSPHSSEHLYKPYVVRGKNSITIRHKLKDLKGAYFGMLLNNIHGNVVTYEKNSIGNYREISMRNFWPIANKCIEFGIKYQ